MLFRVVQSVALASLLAAVGSCGGGELILDPGASPPPLPKPEWNAENCPDGLAGQHLRITLLTTAGQIEIGDTLSLDATAWNSAGKARCRPFLRIDAHLRLVDSTSVVATELGATRIAVLFPNDSAIATLKVVPALPIIPRRYRVTDLTAAVGNDSAQFGRMNARREVIGNLPGRALLWRADGITYLDGCARAFDINVRGEIPCFLNPGMGVWRDGSITAIPELSATKEFYPMSMAINDSGVVAGSSYVTCPQCGLFEFRNGQFVAFGGERFDVRRVNNAGTIFASQFRSTYDYRGYAIQDGRLTDTLYIGTGQLTDANDSGVIVGSEQGHPGSPLAFVRTASHTTQERLAFGVARSVNNAGHVVGTLQPQSAPGEDPTQVDYSQRGAFYWDRAGGVRRLRWSAIDPSWTITDALQILDDGTILGKADNVALGRIGHTVLLVPAF